ncbi:DegT/DnrJ/EryC1/StrS family aminotransferase [Duganella callida]|uniref:DegT/DnrJ/EryC1/StrS aminotransferase family protein n=1 Tax=Duganella callida TaxID=2561932 RepID=A0A4Y9SAV3_9BURK|nr:DegT/DnrJ/EryC1/StrS family aminotransferase [Duganella callida]TFW17286.1 hypothetical protein E4L98_21185 [Duganella callida]
MADFHHFDPTPCHFPIPGAPVLPAWRGADLHWSPAGESELLDGPGVRHYSRGRYALHAALEASGVGQGAVLLAPAYHCLTMVDPALALGAGFRCYGTDEHLVPDLAQVRALLDAADGAVKAVLVPHYFGIEQPPAVMAQLLALCRSHGATLIEDCSHAWQVAARRVRAGVADGVLLVGSPYKFFACEDGGILWGPPARLAGLAPRALPWRDELRGLRDAWVRNRAAHRAPVAVYGAAKAMTGKATAVGGDATGGGRGVHSVERRQRPSAQYRPELEGVGGLRLSRWIMRRTDVEQVAQARRQHYRQWLQAVQHLAAARAPHPTLADDCAPYMFPLLLADPEPQFYALKRAGVPVWRWDNMALSDCPVGARYRLSLLHLPCHQGLSAEQMTWLTSTVARVLS